MKLKDLVKAEDTGNIILKEDAFQRGEEYYQVEPKWDRKVDNLNYLYGRPSMWARQGSERFRFYREFEVTEEGVPVEYTKSEHESEQAGEPGWITWLLVVVIGVAIGPMAYMSLLLWG